MHRYKKLTAFIAALLLGASAAAMPLFSASADNDETTTTSEAAETETTTQAQEETAPAEDTGTKTSGDFTYSVTSDNTACIVDCSFTGDDLVIPEKLDGITVAELGKNAFGTTDKDYVTIELPATLNYVSSANPFNFCPKLKEIKVASSNADFTAEDGILFSKDKKTLVCYPQAKSGSKYTIPDTVEKIYSAGIYNTELSEIVFPASLKDTDYAAFNSNHNIKSVDLSGTALNEVCAYAFAECTSLTEIKFPKDIYQIAEAAFWGCTSLEEVELPDGLEVIGQNAFMDTGLTSVHIPSSVREIRYCAFGYKSDMYGNYTPMDKFTLIGPYGGAAQIYATDKDEEYDYENNFTYMTENEFAANEELNSLDKVTVENYTYAKFDDHVYIVQCTASDKEVTVPSEFRGLPVTGAYPTAFTTCTAEKIILPEGMKELREMTFYNCPYAKTIVLPKSLEKIGNNCFDGCNALEELDCGGASEIGDSVFINCVMLRKITISGSCKSMGAYMPFSTCYALEEINVTEDGDGDFSSKDGVLFNKEGDILIEYPLNRQESVYKVPEGTKEIGVNAFSDCKTIKDVVLPKSLKTLGDYAFYNCSELKKLRAYKKLDKIGTYAFGFMKNSAYDSSSTDSKEHLPVEGFKLYTSKKTTAYSYAKDNDLTVVTGTVRIGDKNVSIPILAVSGSVILLGLITLIISLVKKRSPKKSSPAPKKKSAEKPADKDSEDAQDEEAETDEDENEAQEDGNDDEE